MSTYPSAMTTLKWRKTVLANQWVLHAKTQAGEVARDRKKMFYVRGVMRIHPDYKLTPRKRIFLGWKVYQVDSNGFTTTQVGPRIWQLKKAQDFAETVWRMSSG